VWDRRTLERELAALGVGELEAGIDGRTTGDLYEYQVGPTDPTVHKAVVKDWIRSLNVVSVKLTASATPDNATIQASAKVSPLPFSDPVRMWIQAGDLERIRRGQVGIDLKVEYEGTEKIPRSSKVARANFKMPTLRLGFSCTAEGAISLERKPGRLRSPWSDDLGIDVELYQRKDRPKNSPMRGIPPAVWNEWMGKFCILRIVLLIKLTVTDGAGWHSMDVKAASVPLPERVVAGSTGPRTAVLGPMTIDLVPEGARPPLTAKQGLIKDVYFGVDSPDVDRTVEGPDGRLHQGNRLDDWIRADLIGRWDVREALYRGDLPIRGEARASATLRGRSKEELLRYNQTLSEKRRSAVADRLRKTITRLDKDLKLDANQIQIEAVGASKAPVLGEENVFERRCRLRIDAPDLETAIKKLYKERHRWWWDR
jgi:hypothetical protein